MGGWDYAKVHLLWTIPPSLLLFYLPRRIRSSREVIKTNTLIVIAIISTIPWDSYLIRNKIWSYPPSSVIGPTLFQIPYEEVFFFFIQTYMTASLYALLSRPVIHSVLLPRNASQGRLARWSGTLTLIATTIFAAYLINLGQEGTYLGLILVWVCPFLSLLWFLASDHIIAMPSYATLLPIAIPTVYLWILDSVALRRGTWVIESGTKLGLEFYGLEIEEAIFFFLTNVLIVFGLIACDYSLAIHDTYPQQYPLKPNQFPSILSVLKSVVTSSHSPDCLDDLKIAISLLKDKSKSFYVASLIFEGKLKLDLLSLYSFCRVADDLVDEATSSEAAMANIALIETYLDLIYPVAVDVSTKSSPAPASSDLKSQIDTLLSPLPAATRSAFTLLATLPIPRAPLDELLTGFKTDLNFSNKETSVLPIKTDADLFLYSQNVASSVAELCVRLVWANDGFGTASTELEREEVIRAAREMGVALQLVNICRDVPADRLLGRSYLPGFSLAASAKETTVKRRRLLCLARKMALESGPKIDRLPLSARGGIRAACKVYLEIGNEVEKALDAGDIECRARVSGLKRISVAWKAIGEYSWTGN